MTTIFPTGTCFDDTLVHQSDLFKTNPLLAMRQFIVHGICLVPEGQSNANEPFAHSWVEDDATGMVWQSGFIDGQKVWYGTPRADWYPLIRVQTSTRYTFIEAIGWNYKTNYYGPWEPAYLALCRPRGTQQHERDEASHARRTSANIARRRFNRGTRC